MMFGNENGDRDGRKDGKGNAGDDDDERAGELAGLSLALCHARPTHVSHVVYTSPLMPERLGMDANQIEAMST